MTLWVSKPKMQQKIFDYFSSVDCMSLRIMEERQKVQENYINWDKMSANEQEQKIDEWMIPAESRSNFATKESNLNVFPTFKVETGQKIAEMHVLTEKNEITTSWNDEFSDPFTIESKSQMDVRLPDREGNIRTKRKKSNASSGKGSHSGSIVGSQNGGLFGSRNGSLVGGLENGSTKNGDMPDLIGELNSGFLGGTRTVTKSTEKYFDIDFSNNEALNVGKNELPDEPVAISGFHDFSNEFDWREPNDTPTFAAAGLAEIAATGLAEKDNQKASKGAKAKTKKEDKRVEKTSDITLDFASKPEPRANASESELFSQKPKSPVTKMKERKKDKKSEVPQSTAAQSKPKKGHRKKSSSGNSVSSNQINPRLSLTLDGAIKNLEVAVEQNRQQKTSHTLPHSQEDDTFVNVEQELDFDNIFPDKRSQEDSPLLDPSDLKGSNSDVHKSGFDFLDNW